MKLTNTEPNKHFMKINRRWILPGTALVIGVFMLGWLTVTNRTPAPQSRGLEPPEEQTVTATERRNDIRRNGHTSTTAVPVETTADSITRQKSTQQTAGGTRNSLVDRERALTSAATDDLETIFLVTKFYQALPPATDSRQADILAMQNIKMLPPPAAGHAKNTANENTLSHPQAATDQTGNPQNPVVAVLDSSVSPATRELDEMATNAASFTAPPTVNTASEDTSSIGSSHTTTSAAIAMREDINVQQPTIITSHKGPWVINLVSSTSKADADRMTDKALSRDIQTEQQKVTLNGKQYWRVQITGFATAKDAKKHSEIAKEMLGLKSVWIMKR